MTKLEIINDTVAYYSADVSRRSKRKSTCLYKGPDGKECAFQRAVETDLSKFDEDAEAVRFILGKGGGGVIFKPQYAGHNDWLFWEDIQRIHDLEMNWDDNGLSEHGKEFVERLRVQWADK